MKPLDINHEDKRWAYYDVILDDVYFEWPDPFDDGVYHAKMDCIIYLNKTFDGKYKIRSFKRRTET